MKMTLDIHDALLARAKRHTKETGRPAPAHRRQYELPDLRIGDPNSPDPFVTYSWPRLRGLIYCDSGAR